MERLPDAAPLFSVIVPVWNDAERLRRCLTALLTQSLDGASYEVIVVDNGSTDDTLAVAQELARNVVAGGACQIAILEEITPGSYHARTRGLQAAAGRYIAFTDADCIPAADWLENALVQISSDPRIGVIAGRIELFEERTCRHGHRSQAALDYEQTFSFDQKRNVGRGVAVTANWISPRHVIDEVGGFDTTHRSGGDWKLAAAISEAGRTLVYSAECVVSHPARTVLSDLAAKRRRVVGGAWTRERPGNRGVRLMRRALADWARKSWRTLGNKQLTPYRRLGVLGVIAFLSGTVLMELLLLSCGSTPRR